MPFDRRVLPIRKIVKDDLNNRFQQETEAREQAIQDLQDQIDALKRDASISDMPDYVNAKVVWSIINQKEAQVPIVKVNAPCWFLCTSGGYSGRNQDCMITLGGSTSAWSRSTTTKLIGLQGTCSDDNSGGAFMAPIYPGTSTYACGSWTRSGDLGSYMLIIPTVSVTRYFDQQGIDYNRLYTNTGVTLPTGVTGNNNKIAIPGSNEWRAIFQGDWRDNF